MTSKRHARPNRRKKAKTHPTFRAAVLAFLTTFGGVIAALTGIDPGFKLPTWPDGPSAPVARGPSSDPRTTNAPPVTGVPFSACRDHFPNGDPPPVQATLPTALCFEAFAVLHSGSSKTPVYVVERLTRASLAAAEGLPRSDEFYPEARLPAAHRAQLEDYRGSGFDRGHMAPAGDMPTANAKAQSFSLANMVPQLPELNQKAWNQIEQATRQYAERAGGDAYVYTGPYFGRTVRTIGPGKVRVPAATWKVVYSPSTGRRWAYWMKNDKGPYSLKPIDYSTYLSRGGPDVLPAAMGH